MVDSTKDFLGQGWKFPPSVDARGRIELVGQEEDIEESIRIILLTNKGERPMRPEFGSELFTLEFQPGDMSTVGLARRYVIEALARWEPRIGVTEVHARIDPRHPERLLVSIDYKIRATNTARNLVFPYYTIPGEG
jgi:phage baseplate assembly protein W